MRPAGAGLRVLGDRDRRSSVAAARRAVAVVRPAWCRLAGDACSSGDELALGAFAETGRWVGTGLAGLVNLLNPEIAVLGGLSPAR